MAFYPQFPQAAIYAYPMPFPNQEFYAMYPQGGGTNLEGGYFESSSPYSRKPGYNNRKESTDSGISDFSSISGGANSRKVSSISTISNSSAIAEESLEEVKEDLTPMEEPSDDLCENIVTQVEFYFSDANITKDKFLLKHVKRNKEGFVSLKLISSFKRVKHLTKDWRQVAVAIERKSKRLEVNDLKTKVRRLESLPEYDETTPSRTVVALNLPIERPTIEAVAEMFRDCGEIVLVRILRPGNPIPADVKPFANKHPEMTDKVCALIEYERTEFAHKAVRDLNNEKEAEAMKVMELTAPPPKKTKDKSNAAFEEKRKFSTGSNGNPMMKPGLQQPQRRFSHAGFGMQQQQPQMASDAKRKISLFHNMKFNPILEEQAPTEQQKKDYGLNPNAPSFTMQYAPMQSQSHHHGRRSLRYIPMESPMMMMQPVLVNPPHHRRFSAISAGQAELAVSGLALPPNVIRLPRGPDKGKGFQKWCKARMTPSAQPSQPAAAPVQRKSRAIPIVAPPALQEEPAKQEPVSAAKPAAEGAPEGAAALPVEQNNNNLVVNLAETSSDSDEGHFSDHDLEPETERTR